MVHPHQRRLSEALLQVAQLSNTVLRAAGTPSCSTHIAELRHIGQGAGGVTGLLRGVRSGVLHVLCASHGCQKSLRCWFDAILATEWPRCVCTSDSIETWRVVLASAQLLERKGRGKVHLKVSSFTQSAS